MHGRFETTPGDRVYIILYKIYILRLLRRASTERKVRYLLYMLLLLMLYTFYSSVPSSSTSLFPLMTGLLPPTSLPLTGQQASLGSTKRIEVAQFFLFTTLASPTVSTTKRMKSSSRLAMMA